MEADDLQLAIAYADLASSIAFKDFMATQAMESERLELIALTASPTQFEECRSAIIAWQQHRRIIRSLEELVLNAKREIKSTEQENLDARPDRSNW